jgi:hypothetical protein
MERRGDPGAESNIEEVDWIWPQIHTAPVQIDHRLEISINAQRGVIQFML